MMTSKKLWFVRISIVLTLFMGCKKETEKKYCWQLYDNLGNTLTVICNKTEQELLDCRDCGIFNGQTGVRLGDIIGCRYDQSDAAKFCWEKKCAGQTTYSGNYCDLSEKIANCFLANGCAIRKK
jgi:hypothetical protein